jgi:hypothetical protein
MRSATSSGILSWQCADKSDSEVKVEVSAAVDHVRDVCGVVLPVAAPRCVHERAIARRIIVPRAFLQVLVFCRWVMWFFNLFKNNLKSLAFTLSLQQCCCTISLSIAPIGCDASSMISF